MTRKDTPGLVTRGYFYASARPLRESRATADADYHSPDSPTTDSPPSGGGGLLDRPKESTPTIIYPQISKICTTHPDTTTTRSKDTDTVQHSRIPP